MGNIKIGDTQVRKYITTDFINFTNKGLTDDDIKEVLISIPSINTFYETGAFSTWHITLDSYNASNIQYIMELIEDGLNAILYYKNLIK